MRIDKYLKVTRLIKRREIAKQMLNLGYISINNKISKPSSNVAVGDIVSFNIPNKRELIVEVLEICNNANLQKTKELYKIQGAIENEFEKEK